MELEVRRRESTGSGPNTYVETETLAKYELMDGAPVRGTLRCDFSDYYHSSIEINLLVKPCIILKMHVNVAGESIPVRLFLSPYELTPTYRNINNKFSVKYYLNLVLVDEEDRRYFKQQEITVYRLMENS